MAQRKPTVLFLAAWYPTPIQKSHGIFIRNHAIALSEFCHVIVAYAYSSDSVKQTSFSKNTVNANFEEWIVAYKKTPGNLPFFSGLLKYINFKKAYRLLAQKLLAEKTDIKAIQLNAIYPAAIALPVFKKYWPVPHSVLEHWTGYLPGDGNYKGLLLKYFTRKTIASSSQIFYVSEEQKRAMLEQGLKGNYELIYNVVDTSVFNLKPTASHKKPLLLHVSSLDDRQKNIRGILNVIGLLQAKNYEFDFVFIGGNQQLAAFYSELASTQNLKNIVFAGSKNPAEISQYMQQSKALLLFSNYENMPVVVLEALACGLPVIATNTGCLDTIIKTGFGKLIDIGDENALEKSLVDLLDGKITSEPAAMNAYVNSKASYPVVGKQLYEHYKALLDS